MAIRPWNQTNKAPQGNQEVNQELWGEADKGVREANDRSR